MKINSRSYGGKLFRPTPEILEREDGLIVVATPWGPRSSAKNLIHIIDENFSVYDTHTEITYPFGVVQAFSPLVNRLRTALLMANYRLYEEENSSEYQTGVEVLAICPDGEEISLAQIGGPSVFVDRQNTNLIPLVAHWDLATEICKDNQLLTPLPKDIAGIDPSIQMNITSIRRFQSDRLILLSRSYIPNDFYTLSRQKRNVDTISEALSQSDPNCPFWLGVVL